MEAKFSEEYKKLNKNQKEAVDTIDGPVMVVAGPGTGKTQILALRIGSILKKTDIKADGILCLTFTNSAVEAMRGRLVRYLGETGKEVNVATFHSFGMTVIGEYFTVLGLETAPKLLDDVEAAALFDEVLDKNSWEYLRPRGDRTRYFSDLRSLFSLLKKEGLTSKYFKGEVEKEIKQITNDPDSLSTRGESKGEFKKEIVSKMEGLEKSLEVVKFLELYEETKKIKNVFDYDDVLENLVKIVETSQDAAADIREKYLYVLVDEHQDSSRVQNEFLRVVWGEVENPNIFVVGDDRQLIYGFSGASIDHFKGFRNTWRKAELITLVDNYRSTQIILDLSHALLPSVMTREKLQSQSKEHHSVRLVEAAGEEYEIIACAEDLKAKIKKGVDADDCAVLVPKNAQVREALKVLHREGLPVSALDTLNLFEEEKAQEFIRVLRAVTHPEDNVSFTRSFLDDISGISAFEADRFLASQKMRAFSLNTASKGTPSLFGGAGPEAWIDKLQGWRALAEKENPILVMEKIAEAVSKKEEKGLVTFKEILTTLADLFTKEKDKKPELTLGGFLDYLSRLESYNEDVPIIVEQTKGVKVLTLHSSKGLEFDYVWIAHMDERGLNSGKRSSFTLPEAIADILLESDVDRHKRKLYVAITRAKRYCTISYSPGEEGKKEVARVIADLPPEILVKDKFTLTKRREKDASPEIIKLVGAKYKDKIVSASSLNNFFECAWKWYFRNFLGLPEAENENLIFGSKVHAAIDEILKSGKIVLPEDKEVAEVVGAWAKARLPEIAQDRKNEEPLSFRGKKFPHLNIFGRIDLIEKMPNGSLRITDFKTGNSKKKSEILKLDEEGRMSNLLRQLAMYSYLLENSPAWGGIKVSGNRLEFLEAKNPKDKIYEHIKGEDEAKLLVKDIGDYDLALKDGTWVSRECHYNSYGKNTVCEYCRRAEIYTDPLSSQPK